MVRLTWWEVLAVAVLVVRRWWCARIGHRWTEDAPAATVVFDNCARCGEFKRAVLAREFGR